MSTDPNEPVTSTERKTLSFGRRWIIVLALLALAVGVARLAYQRSIHVYTDDARVAADLVVISSKVAGRVEELAVKEGSRVRVGDLIVQLDSRETSLRLEELKAQLKAAEASIAQSQAELVMVEQQTAASLQGAQSGLVAASAGLASAVSDYELKRSEWVRSESLLERGILSKQHWEQARSAMQVATQNQNRSQAEVATATARLHEANAARERIAVLEQKRVRLRHDRDRVAFQLGGQQVNLEERRIDSPLDGVVDQSFVNSGEYLMSGQRIALMHNPDRVWIRANIKETEIRHVQVGQPVRVTVDAYPDRVFRGEVERIGNAATSQFALFPSTNPSGNFTKVTQRLPVKISVQQEDQMLKPGMMVEIAIELFEH